MKIAIIAVTLCKGGAQRMLVELANGLKQRGHDITIVMSSHGIVEFPLNVKIIRTKTQDITVNDIPDSDVIVSTYYSLIQVCEQASLAGKGIHVRISLCYEPVFLPNQEVSFKSYHISKNLIVLSAWQKQVIKLNHGIDGETVPVGISGAFHNMGLRNGKALRVSGILRIPEGGYSWHRDQEYLTQTLNAIKHKYPDVVISLITHPNELKHSPTLRSVHSNQNFESLHPADDTMLNHYLNITDIFISTSTFDTGSLPGLEAMKCGAAVTTIYSGGNADYCRHNHNCLLSYRYENKLFEHISFLIDNPEHRYRIAKEGEKEAAKWTWEKSVDAFESAIKKFIARI
ncbi:glycosyltransferase family 4 protein [Pseudalkalibacillus decolorationis]|uniref:glycosyltransferase family 4 protein n=1 Tax=Pseudalkalibacillus decolorationis TaxID=163879 RepID=UPI00214982E6|nr:glycosyltransferase family 4 protein [Pseudalkalibacillus decolorationis]